MVPRFDPNSARQNFARRKTFAVIRNEDQRQFYVKVSFELFRANGASMMIFTSLNQIIFEPARKET